MTAASRLLENSDVNFVDYLEMSVLQIRPVNLPQSVLRLSNKINLNHLRFICRRMIEIRPRNLSNCPWG